MNRYSYVENDPINNVDPSGEDWYLDGSDISIGMPWMSPNIGELDEFEIMSIPIEAEWGAGENDGWHQQFAGYLDVGLPMNGAPSLQVLVGQIYTRLLQDSDCLGFLGRNDPHALDTIANTPVGVGDVSADPNKVAVTNMRLSPKSSVPTDASITVNQNATAFFNTGGTVHLYGGSTPYQTGSAEFQAATLLHGFGHATGALLQNDGASAASEKENNRQIEKHCQKTINSFSRGAN